MRRLSSFLALALLSMACGTRFPATSPEPRVGRIHPNTGPAAGGTLLVIEGLAFQPGAKVFFGEAEARVTYVSSLLLTATAPAGDAAVDVAVVNPDGLRSTVKGGFTFVAAPEAAAPKLTGMTPSSGPATGRTFAELWGSDFDARALVFVGGVPATDVTTAGAELVTALLPAGEPGPADVAITNSDGQTAVLAQAFTRAASTSERAPLITGILPTGGPASGDVKGTLTGDGFARASRVYIGGRPAPHVFQSDTLLDVSVPPGRVGLASVAVTNPDGQSDFRANLFGYYQPAPVLFSVMPDVGPVEGGTKLTIVGANLTTDTVVTFADQPAAKVTYVDEQTLDVVTPPMDAFGPVEVVVKNRDGQKDAKSAGFYFFDADHPPQSTTVVLKAERVLPASGASTGGTLVMVSGSGFIEGARVSFGANASTDVRVVSSSALAVRTPTSAPGPVDVVVTNPGNATSTIRHAFTYFDAASSALAPVVSGIAPSTGPAAGGTRGVLAGRNFAQGAIVYFGEKQAARTTVVDASRITFVTPVRGAGLSDVTVVNPDGKSARLQLGFGFYEGDGAGPEITELDPPSAQAGREASVVVNGGNFATGAQLFIGEVPATDVVVANGGQISAKFPALPPAAYPVSITNPDGRSFAKEDAFRFTTPTPKVTRAVPAIGPTTGGVRVLVQGESFLQGAQVLFGSEAATEVTWIEEGALLALSPAGSAGKVDVSVVNPGGVQATLPLGFEYREGYVPLPPPQLESVTPPSGPASGGSVLLLKGTHFQEGMLALFGPNPARRVLVGKAGEAIVVAPAGTVGPVNLTLVNPDGQVGGLDGAYRYVDANALGAAPVLTGVIPDKGPETRATDILVTGRRFAQGAMIFVGKYVSPYARRDSDTLVSSRAPAGQVGAVDVAITNPDGQSSILEDGFTYRAAPSIGSVSPQEAPDKGGRQVQIFGEFFEPNSRVFFGTLPADATQFVGPTLLVATTPAHAAGTFDVVVANSDGQEAVLEDGFTFRAPPQVSLVVPAGGPVTGGSVVAVTGRNFVPGAIVRFDDKEVTAGFGDENTLAIEVPPGAYAGQEVRIEVENPDGQVGDRPKGFRYLDPALFSTPDPTLASIAPPTGPETGGTWAVLRGASLEKDVIAFVGNRLMSQVKVAFGTSITGVVPGGPRGTVRVAITNPDGRTARLADAFTFTDPATLAPAPTVASTSPQGGITRGGEAISIGGTNFATASAPIVILAGYPAGEVTPVASTTLSVKTGPGVVGRGSVVVTNPDGRSAVLADAWTYESTAPTLRETDPILPTSGPTRGGTEVTLYGLDFEFGAEVHFGSAQATSVRFVSPTELKARTPPGPIDSVDVTVVNPGGKFGTRAKAFTFVPPPLVFSVNPASGPQAGGNAIVINGRYFLPGPAAVKVRVGSNEATGVKVESGSVLSAVAPAGTGTAAITIVNGDGQITELPSGYVYLPSIQPPTITSVSPDNGEAAGNTFVTIVGGGFSAGAKVFFVSPNGEVEGTDVRVMSDGALTCRTPAGTEGTSVAVKVRNPPHPGGAEVVKSAAFTYRAGRDVGELKLSFVSPQQGPCAGGTEIVIGGQGIKNGAKVYLDGVEQDDIRVFGPTAIAARTRPYGDPANCPKTPVTVRVQNPTLELAELTGTQRFEYSGNNRRFVHADGDRLPAESYSGKALDEGNIPVVARLTGASGGGRNLSDILVARATQWNVTDSGNFLYAAPTFKLPHGVFWSDNRANLFKYTNCANKVRPIGKGCTDSEVSNYSSSIESPVVADFDLNQWPDVLFYDRRSNLLSILYNDAGVLTRYDLGNPGALCSTSGICSTGSWSAHAVANFDGDAAGKVDIAIATTGIDVVLRNETTPTQEGRRAWVVWPPRGATSFLRYQNGAIPSGDDSRGMEAADVDGDGDVDLMVANYNVPVKTYLSNLNNQGALPLEQRQQNLKLQDAAGAPFGTSTAWSGPMRDLRLADFDKDGDPDLLITHQRQQDEYWSNDGNGRFTNETLALGRCGTGRRLPAVTNQAAYSAQVIDLDADSDLDLVQWLEACSGCAVPRPLRIYRNDAQTGTPTRAGCFVEATNDFFPTDDVDGRPEMSRNMAFAELDGDGFPDAVYAGADDQQNRVYFNVPSGTKRAFRDRTRVRLPNRWFKNTMAAALLDVDGDADLDLFTSTSNSAVAAYPWYLPAPDSRLRLALNDGSGHFTDATQGRLPDVPLMAMRYGSGDIDGDGDTDLLLPNFAVDNDDTNATDGAYLLYLNDGSGNFADRSYPRLPAGDHSNKLYGRAVALHDLDEDGDLDALVGAGRTGCVRVWMNTGSAYFTDVTPTAAPWWSLASCQGAGYSYSPNHARDIIVSDFDFNDTPDVFIAGEGGNQLYLNCPDTQKQPRFFRSTGSAPCAPPNAPFIPPGVSLAAVKSVRDDGGVKVTDILHYSADTSSPRLWRGSRATPGRLSDETVAFLPSLPPVGDSGMGFFFAPLDFDKDGDLDFFYAVRQASAPNRILRYGSSFTDVRAETGGSDPLPYHAFDEARGAVAGDVNGDGFDDVIVLNHWTPRVLISSP